ncbi:MAG TPA: mannose-6-phosphate isomerase, class I [Streptosporangiaceae bacterium]
MDLLQPVIRPYAWGSWDAIAELQGRTVPADGPEAELWMGAHPSAPSGLSRNGVVTTLDAVIARDPARELGTECVARYGGRLPFLLKVLSAESALSIQVHPSRAQAETGYAEEKARGLTAGDPSRNYVDNWPKPELLCAITSFEVLAGMRDPADAAALLKALAGQQPALVRLAPVTGSLAASAADPRVVSCALASILAWPAEDRTALVDDVVAACTRLAAEDGPYAAACAAIARVSADHPGDIGVVAALLLRHAVLAPGQAVFMPAGGLHAYLRGTGVELLANSDNVVRAGLTGKHIDVPELLKLLDPSVAVPAIEPAEWAPRVVTYATPAPEFKLYRADLDTEMTGLPGAGPRIVLCVEGSATLKDSSGEVTEVDRGESCFLSDTDGSVSASGPARLFLATTGN